MFLHNFKYALKTMLKTKSVIIWTLLFPIALGTFMYMSFGDIFEKDGAFKVVDVAVVKNVENEAFETMLDELSDKDNTQLLNVSYLSEEDAETAIEKEDVAGIIYMNGELSLSLKESSYEGTILQTVMNEYLKQENVLNDIAQKDPAMLEAAIANMNLNESFCDMQLLSDGNLDVYTNYFYAIFAMSCLFASFGAVEKVCKMQANVSALGMRRCIGPNSKMLTIASEFISMLIVQFIIEVIVLIYFNLIGVDFGNKYLPMLGILFFGSCIGIAIGIIIGTIKSLSENSKIGITLAISMFLSVLADLIVIGIKNSIENNMPIINRINPAALITDSFYALNIYDTYDRYLGNMLILGIMTVVLLAISFLVLRRNKYASV